MSIQDRIQDIKTQAGRLEGKVHRIEQLADQEDLTPEEEQRLAKVVEEFESEYSEALNEIRKAESEVESLPDWADGFLETLFDIFGVGELEREMDDMEAELDEKIRELDRENPWEEVWDS